MPSLVESLTNLITPQIAGSVASRLGESEGAVRQGLLAGASSILSAIASRSSDSAFIGRIFSLVTSPANDASVASRLSSLESGVLDTGTQGLGSKLLESVF